MLPLLRVAAAAMLLLGFAPLRASCAADVKGDSRFVAVEGTKVHYTNYGSGNTALVFIHGWACDETSWDGQTPELAETMRPITIDLPGHGQSDKPQIAYTMDLYARAIDAVLGDAKVSKAVLVGHSNGTPVIRNYYRRFPEKVAALVIVDGALRPFVDASNIDKFLAPLRGPNYSEAAGQFIGRMTKPIADEALRERIKKMMLSTPQHVAVSEFEGSADPQVWTPDKIEAPVLMILAKQPVWTEEYEQFVRSIVPNLDYQLWENVSHFLMLEKPREFNAALVAFLQKNDLER
jgi:pimeloyl-ACP methyl ester carboxylesterase